MEITSSARRVLSIHARLRAAGERERDAIRQALLAGASDPASAIARVRADQRLPAPVRERLAPPGVPTPGPAAPAPVSVREPDAPLLDSPFAVDAADLAAAELAPLSTRHLLLSAWRQMSGAPATRVVPSRLLLDLTGGDRPSALALYALVLAERGWDDADKP